MPNARRVIFSSYVVPTQSVELEEDSIRKTEFMASPGKTLGGKGIATINATQWNDGWTSMMHSQVNWEDLDDNTDTTGNWWEDAFDMWGGIFTVTSSGIKLTVDTSPLAFLYIRNIDPRAREIHVALDGGTNYYIDVPAGGSLHLRGDGTQLLCSEVYVETTSGTADIEYILAQE
jgi:hypothetical protein